MTEFSSLTGPKSSCVVVLRRNRSNIRKLDSLFVLNGFIAFPPLVYRAHSVAFPNLIFCSGPARPGRRPCSLMARSHACLSCVMVIGGCCKVCAVLFPHRDPSASPLWGSSCFCWCCFLALMIIAVFFLPPPRWTKVAEPEGGPANKLLMKRPKRSNDEVARKMGGRNNTFIKAALCFVVALAVWMVCTPPPPPIIISVPSCQTLCSSSIRH